ncbi:MAG TPA: hypothetical protein VLH79_06380, partial [Chthonomonadales bacterium]|nr:hypothetical protein [Chthonomonadales bacterium]
QGEAGLPAGRQASTTAPRGLIAARALCPCPDLRAPACLRGADLAAHVLGGEDVGLDRWARWGTVAVANVAMAAVCVVEVVALGFIAIWRSAQT